MRAIISGLVKSTLDIPCGRLLKTTIAAHIHPHGQDTWTVLSGMADYFQGNGIVRALREGEIAVARPGQVHGARNTGTEPF
ncbi:cupin domain-containing protein, partial [Thauera phenylacetica]|uniref:cupin domain-containing protein n=1 Tax=Thauera phenylacetica TaxID=164400 RepID=UPI0039E64F13